MGSGLRSERWAIGAHPPAIKAVPWWGDKDLGPLTLSPGIPGKPVIPGSPFRPGKPRSPMEPGEPGLPLSPLMRLGKPGAPGKPGGPGWPASPLSPGKEAEVLGKHSGQEKICSPSSRCPGSQVGKGKAWGQLAGGGMGVGGGAFGLIGHQPGPPQLPQWESRSVPIPHYLPGPSRGTATCGSKIEFHRGGANTPDTPQAQERRPLCPFPPTTGTHTAALRVFLLWGLFSVKKLGLVMKTVLGFSSSHSLPQYLWVREIQWLQLSPENLCLL